MYPGVGAALTKAAVIVGYGLFHFLRRGPGEGVHFFCLRCTSLEKPNPYDICPIYVHGILSRRYVSSVGRRCSAGMQGLERR